MSNNKTLHLNLKRQWYDLTESGEKKEDYRELTNYWLKRLFDRYAGFCGEAMDDKTESQDIYDFISKSQKYISEELTVSFDTVTLSNGYAKDRPQFTRELKEIVIDKGREDWGAEPGRKYFVIRYK